MDALLQHPIARLLKVIAALIVSAVVVYRGNAYTHPDYGASLIVPLMCVVAAIIFSLTAIVSTFQQEPALD